MRYLLLLATIVLVGCGPNRVPGPGAARLASYRYCVVPVSQSNGWDGQARSILGRVFQLVPEDDARLRDPESRSAACVAVTDGFYGLWHDKGRVELHDYADNALLMRTEARVGMFYFGAQQAVVRALEEMAAARRDAGPVQLAP
jgi:hypothetical protein